MRQLLVAQLAVEAAQFAGFILRERPAIRAIRKLEHRRDVFRLGSHEALLEGRRALHDRLAQRFEALVAVRRVGTVLRRVLPDLLEGIDERERVMADVVQLVPEPVELRFLRVIEEQPREVLILAMKERERDHFIDRHDFRVAQRRREHLPEFLETRLDALARGAAFIRHNRRAERNGLVAGSPRALDIDQGRAAGAQARRGSRLGCDDLQLHAALRAAHGIERARDNQLAARDQVGRQANLDGRRRLHAKACGVNGSAVRMLAEARRVESPLGGTRGWRDGGSGGRRGFDAGKQGAGERRELAVERGVRGITHGRRGGQELLHGLGQRWFLARLRGLPAREQRTGRNHRAARRAVFRLGVKIPNAVAPGLVRVRISREDAAGNIARQRPFLRRVAGLGELQLEVRQVARVIAVARPDHQRHQIAGLHGDVFERSGDALFVALREAAREALARAAAAQFERPRHAIAATRMRVRHRRFDAQRRRHRTAPADGGRELLRGMHDHAVRLEIARNPHGLIGGIGQQQRRAVGAPAFDKIVVG